MLNYIGFSTGYFDFIEFRLKITIDSIKNRRYIIRQIYLRTSMTWPIMMAKTYGFVMQAEKLTNKIILFQ